MALRMSHEQMEGYVCVTFWIPSPRSHCTDALLLQDQHSFLFVFTFFFSPSLDDAAQIDRKLNDEFCKFFICGDEVDISAELFRCKFREIQADAASLRPLGRPHEHLKDFVAVHFRNTD